MNEGQRRWAAALLLCLVGLSTILLVVEPRVESQPGSVMLPTLDLSQADRVVLRRMSGDVELQLTEGRWRVGGDEGWLADAWIVKDLLQKLGSIDSGLPAVGELSKFGLGEGQGTTLLVSAGGTSMGEWRFGELSQVGGRIYMLGPSGEPLAVKTTIDHLLTAPRDAFRDRRIWILDPYQIDRVTLASQFGTLDLMRRGLGWHVDGYGPADPIKVEDLLVSLADLRLETWTGVDLSETGNAVVTATVRDVSGVTRQLEVGPADERLAPVSVDGQRLGLILTDVVRFLGQGPSDLVRPNWIKSDPAVVQALDLRGPDREVRVGRDDVNAPWMRDGASVPDAAGLIDRLTGIGIEFHRTNDDRGLSPPARFPWTLTLTTLDGDEVYEISDVGTDGIRWVREPGSTAYRIDAEAFGSWLSGIQATL